MADIAQEEYKALRATIQSRGTLRTCVLVAGLSAWAVVAMASTFVTIPLLSLVPLVLLAAVFEGVFGLHVAVERIGRYLEIYHEDRWEQTTSQFGVPMAGTGTDPLFAALFGLATVANFTPVLLADPVRVEVVLLGAAHAAFLIRLAVAKRAAGKQRAADLERFRALHSRDGH